MSVQAALAAAAGYSIHAERGENQKLGVRTVAEVTERCAQRLEGAPRPAWCYLGRRRYGPQERHTAAAQPPGMKLPHNLQASLVFSRAQSMRGEALLPLSRADSQQGVERFFISEHLALPMMLGLSPRAVLP